MVKHINLHGYDIPFTYSNNKVRITKGYEYELEKNNIISQNNLSDYFNALLFANIIDCNETEIINQAKQSFLLRDIIPITLSNCSYINLAWDTGVCYIYNKDGYKEKVYDGTKKIKYDYIKIENKLLQVETIHDKETVTTKYNIFIFDEDNRIEKVFRADNIEKIRNTEDTPTSILDNIDDELHPSEDDYNIENYYGNSYYMYVYLTDDKIKENTFVYELQLLGGIYKNNLKDNLKETNGKVTLYVKKSLYDKVYNKLKTLTGVKNIEKTTTVVNKETVTSTSKYLMQIWGKDNKFLSREFYTFCSNYR